MPTAAIRPEPGRNDGDSLEPPACDQQAGPVRVAEIADLDHRANPGGRVDEFAFADIHAGVGDVIGRAAEEEQIPGLQILPLHRTPALPCGLHAGTPGDADVQAAW